MSGIRILLNQDLYYQMNAAEAIAKSKKRDFTALDVLCYTPISLGKRIWLVLFPGMIEDLVLHMFACDCAERIQYRNADPRSLAAISAKRAWLRGEITDHELYVAHRHAITIARDWNGHWDWIVASAAHAAAASGQNAARGTADAALQVCDDQDKEEQWQAIHLIELLATNSSDDDIGVLSDWAIDRETYTTLDPRMMQAVDHEYVLLDLLIERGKGRHPFLQMKNPSTGEWHIEGVPPGTRTVAEALEWRNGTTEIPSVLT